MHASVHRIRRLVLGTGLAGVFGFGAAQAVAAPAQDPALPVCVFAECAARCVLRGYDGGTCLTTRSCVCYTYGG